MSEEDCLKPCDPSLGRECCADYWRRMELEGYWNKEKHEWTAKGFKEMCK